MQKELQTFVDWLGEDLTHFVALVEEGSVAAGDPWQEGVSDHDLHVIVADSKDTESKAIYDFLEQNPLGNEYLVTVRLADDFSKGDSLNDISLKFRSKVIVGDDVVTTKSPPSTEAALEIGRSGLTGLIGRFERRLLNLSHWSEDYAQRKNYEIFKNFFVFSAAFFYGKTDTYPVTRARVAELLPNKEAAQKILWVTNNIQSASKPQQKAAIEAGLALINDLIAQ